MAVFNSKLLNYKRVQIASISPKIPILYPYVCIPTRWGPQDSVQLPYKWLKMVDITIVFMGFISWFINQQTYLGSPIL